MALLVTPLRVVAPEISEHPPEEAGGDLPGMEREEDDVVVRVGTPIPSHIDLAGNTSYHFAASRTVFPRVSPYFGPGPFAPLGSHI